jgi:small subunit ribosomal protein S2
MAKNHDPSNTLLSQPETDFNLDIEEMARAGLHFGHRISRLHPKMTPYLAGVRNTIHIIDLEKTKEKLAKALRFIQQLILENKILLIVGTKIQVRDLVKNMAQEFSLPYVIERWLGGTLTNFETIKKRIEYFKDLERKKKEGELEKYTKKEQIKIGQELRELEKKFGGIKNLERLPDAIFVLDMKKDALAVKEARMKGIKLITISDSNTDPTLADYPIPANDDAISSVKYILDKVAEIIRLSKSKFSEKKNETENKILASSTKKEK